MPPTRTLPVERPAKYQFRRTILFSSHPPEPMVDQRRFSDPAPGNDGDDVDLRVCPGAVQEPMSSSRPKTSLPVTGNLARESSLDLILLAASEFRRVNWEGGSAAFRRVIPRRASIAPVIVGIAFSSSSGVWNRCAGSFSRSFSRRTTTGCPTSLIAQAVRARADADTSP